MRRSLLPAVLLLADFLGTLTLGSVQPGGHSVVRTGLGFIATPSPSTEDHPLRGYPGYYRASLRDWRMLAIQPSLAADPGDETALRAVVEQFLAAYQKKDLDALMSLWSSGSPQSESQRAYLQQYFQGHDRIRIEKVAVSRIEVAGDRATLRVSYDRYAIHPATGEPCDDPPHQVRNLVFIREAGAWKVGRNTSAVQDFAGALLAAPTEEARKAILASESELVVPALVQALTQEAARRLALGQNAAALQAGALARRLAQTIGDAPGERAALHVTGHVHERAGRSAAALEAWQAWLKLAEDAGVKADIAEALNDIALIYEIQGSYDIAMESYRKSLALKEETGNGAGAAGVESNIAGVHVQKGDYSAALDLYQKSLARSEALGSRDNAASACLGIGTIYDLQGNYSLALQYFHKALAQYEALGNREGSAKALNNIGIAWALQSNYAEALKFYQKSLGLKEALGDARGFCITMLNVGALQHSMNNPALAIEAFQKVLAQAQSLGDRATMARALTNLGVVSMTQADDQQALRFLQRGLELTDELGEKADSAHALLHIGELHRRRGSDALAMDCFEKGLKTSEAIGDLNIAFRCCSQIGEMYRARGRREEAITACRRAVSLIEAIRSHVAGGEEEKLAYLHAEGKVRIYETLVELLLEQGQVDEALRTLERAKSKQLLDGLRLRSLTAADKNLHRLLLKADDLELALSAQDRSRVAEISKSNPDPTRLRNLTELVARTREELQKAYNQIIAANPGYARFLTVRVPDLAIIQRRLPPGVLVVEYGLFDTALGIFLVTREGMQCHKVAVSRKRLEELVQSFHEEVRLQRNRALDGVPEWDWSGERARGLRETLSALYLHLVYPVRQEIAKARMVVFVPNGVLHYMPFGALARQVADTPSTTHLRFLIEDKPVAVLPSLELLDRITGSERTAPGGGGGSFGSQPPTPNPQHPSPSTARLAAFGNPSGSAPALPAAEQEVRRLGALFPRSLVYVGEQATEARVLELPREVGMAHFATHGMLNAREMNDCYLLLAGGQKLTLGEIYGLGGTYPARLTVLSACQTGLGQGDAEVEARSLADGFLQAGSTAVVASLWSVEDASTAALMERFYGELKSGSSKGEALRQAEIQLLRDPKTAHPFFWAPFGLIGDWR
jgi:CHAT domain-containing protein/Tfp pilus assembly protein PilF